MSDYDRTRSSNLTGVVIVKGGGYFRGRGVFVTGAGIKVVSRRG